MEETSDAVKCDDHSCASSTTTEREKRGKAKGKVLNVRDISGNVLHKLTVSSPSQDNNQ